MDEHEPILPPPPSLRLAVWSWLNVFWFRLAHDLFRRTQHTVLAARQRWLGPDDADAMIPARDHGPASVALLAREGRLTSLVGRLAEDRMARATFARRLGTERPTKVEGPH